MTENMKFQDKKQTIRFARALQGALALLLLFFTGIGDGYAAGGIDLSKIEPLAPVEFLPQEEFEEKTEVIEVVPFEDKALSFRVRLPKEWKLETTPPLKIPGGGLSDQVVGEVARYVSPSRFNLRSFFTLEALELTYEIGARDWLINYLFNNGATLNALTVKSSKEVQALYVIVDGDITYIVRIKAIVNGPRIMLARYVVPQNDYKAERTMQAQAIDSFELTDMEEGGAEEWLTYNFLDQSYFDYPASWTLKGGTVKSIENMQALLFTGKKNIEGKQKDQKPDGQIKVYVISKLLGTSLAREVQAYRQKINIDRYHLGARMEEVKFNYDESMDFGVSEIYEMVPTPITMMPYELVVSVMEGEEYYYIVSMLTPARKMEFYIWARNMEAFRVIVESMRRFNDREGEDDEGIQYFDEE
ncbi:MAG: hypothetical protein H6853_06535 [Rhodospirillales bacterium]|nr:hypothetical protein [Alphaproteobacteria bacterium]USO03188.1 MAG: hypothetical protein H6853_06535 [Rhodospirillales bacterium]